MRKCIGGRWIRDKAVEQSGNLRMNFSVFCGKICFDFMSKKTKGEVFYQFSQRSAPFFKYFFCIFLPFRQSRNGLRNLKTHLQARFFVFYLYAGALLKDGNNFKTSTTGKVQATSVLKDIPSKVSKLYQRRVFRDEPNPVPHPPRPHPSPSIFRLPHLYSLFLR